MLQKNVYLHGCLNNNYMIEQFNFDIQLIFAILNGKVSAAINRKLIRNFRQNGMEITPRAMDGPIVFMGKRRSYTTRIMQCHIQRQTQHDKIDRQYGEATSCCTYIRQEGPTYKPDSSYQNRERTGGGSTIHCKQDT